MSFAGTPLGQGRRLDRGTFLSKQSQLPNKPPEPNRLIPASYTYGAPTLGSRSPPKTSEPSRDPNPPTDESALARFSRAKQREQASLAPGPSTSNVQETPVDPRRWTVKDTSVNIASAFAQAALDMNPNPTDSWHSATSQPRYSRASSVEFEQQRAQAPNRRLADPSARFARKPVSKTDSRQSVPDSEGEEERRPPRNERGKSPFNNMIDSAKRVLGPAAYYLQQKSSESHPTNDPTFPPREPSYDYAAEEEQYNQSMRAQSQRRNRIAEENKAYQPSEDEFSDEDDINDGRGRRRRGKKRDSVGGPLSTLPVIQQDKARRRKRRTGTGEPEEDSFSRSEEQILVDQQSVDRASLPPRGSAPPSRAGSVQPDMNGVGHDSTFDVERALSMVPEADEEQVQERVAPQQPRRRSRSASRGPSTRPTSLIGGPLGSLVNWAVRTLKSVVLYTFQLFSTLFYLLGSVAGTMYTTVVKRPAAWVSGSGGAPLAKIFLIGLLLSSLYLFRESLYGYLPKSSKARPIYQAPDHPAADVAEFSDRLQRIEAILSELSQDAERARIRVDNEARSRESIAGRLGSLESKVQTESKKAADAEAQLRAITKADIRTIQRDVDALQAQLHQQQKQQPQSPPTSGPVWDEERLRALEERVGTLEGGVKEALDLGKKAATHEPQTGTPWWSKITPGSSHKSDVVIKTTDGVDISKLLEDMVDSAVSLYSKDGIAKADFAHYSAGGRVIPSLTSHTLEERPKSLTQELIGFLTRAQYPIGHPPVVALHHDTHNGYCWPFAGSKGQLGVVLAAPVHVSEISIDHVAREVAFDEKTAPRDMEVWGLVEGQDNIEKVKEWQAMKRKVRREAEERGEEVEDELPYPTTLPQTPEYVRVANFTYDVKSPKVIQTFPIYQEIRDLDLDFGIVVLLIKNNWGREYTCLYRMRVHGEQLNTPESNPEPTSDDS